jgi:hypothetical protein
LIAYPAMLDVPRELVRYLGRLLYDERRRRGTPKGSRRLTCFYQALFALAWFRSKPNIRLHGIAFGLSQATAYRYLHEAIDVLAAQAPDLHHALKHATGDISHLILDGKIFDTDRCHLKTTSVQGDTIDAWFSGKTRDFGGNVQMLCEPDGFPIWTSDVEPGGIADIDAARRHVFPAVYPYAKTVPVLADPAYQGAGHGIIVPFKQPIDGNVLSVDNRAHNALQRALRSLGERGFALLTNRWTALQHTTLSPSRIGDLVRAALVLVHFEHRRIS